MQKLKKLLESEGVGHIFLLMGLRGFCALITSVSMARFLTFFNQCQRLIVILLALCCISVTQQPLKSHTMNPLKATQCVFVVHCHI